VVGVSLTVAGGSATDGRDGTVAVTEEYGRRLLVQTAQLIGPDQPDASKRLMNSRLACSSCHLGAGTEPGMLSLLQAAEKYPRFSGRDGGERDLIDRINGCMERSMNGTALPRDNPEMLAMAAYVRSLGDRYAAMGAGQRAVSEPAAFATPHRAASLEAGGTVFRSRCAVCHGSDGLGLLAAPEKGHGYLFPPLWGPDSFNDGAGMHRVLTAARFIKARMPLGKPDLTDDEAFDVAAYINAQPRPAMANLDRDYPDRTTKPVDTSYGPFADPFPAEQHLLGPFQPIEAFYKQQKAAQSASAR
jgi:thiosulfate dehydrogenase